MFPNPRSNGSDSFVPNPVINPSDLFVSNPDKHFLGTGKAGRGESCIRTNMSSNKDISQQFSLDLFSPFERDFSENHSGFHRYVAQKPLFGKSFRNVTKPIMPQSFSSGENDDTESAYQVKVGSDKNLANIVSGLTEKVDGSCSTLASLTTEIKLVRGLIENQVKRNDEIVSEHKNEEGIAELLEKFEVFFQSYKEHARVTSENMENMKCDLKATQDYILKAGESINENQETMKALLLEAVGSIKTIRNREAEQQVQNVYCQLLLDVEDRFSEKIQDLKKLVQLSLQSVKTVDHEKPPEKLFSDASLNSACEDSNKGRCLRSSTKATSDTRAKNMRSVDHNINFSNNCIPVMSLQQNLQTCNTVTVEPINHQATKLTQSRYGKDSNIAKVCETQNSSRKGNIKKVRHFRYVPPKRKGRNRSSSTVRCSPSYQAYDISDNAKICEIISNMSRCSQNNDNKRPNSALSNQSSAMSISQLPFAIKTSHIRTSAQAVDGVKAAPASNSQNWLGILSPEGMPLGSG